MPDPALTVLYDGGCPMCRREIDRYRQLAGGLPIHWVDAIRPEAGLETYGVSRPDVLKVFHVIDSAGTVHRGAWAFITLWAELPRYRWLARACRTWRLAPLLDRIYRRFAARHYARRCRDSACGSAAD